MQWKVLYWVHPILSKFSHIWTFVIVRHDQMKTKTCKPLLTLQHIIEFQFWMPCQYSLQSQECHNISNHQQLSCLCNSLFILTKKTPIFPYHYIIMFILHLYIWWSYRNTSLHLLDREEINHLEYDVAEYALRLIFHKTFSYLPVQSCYLVHGHNQFFVVTHWRNHIQL